MYRTEVHTAVCCAHPYFGFVCTPNSEIDFSDRVPPEYGHSATATIDRDGFRNGSLPAEKPAGEFWVGLFGGSVAFSVPSSSNDTTIAGYLQQALGRSSGRRVRVLNLALPGGQQPQQAIILMMNLHRLDGVVTFDGVNEVVIPSYYNRGSVPDNFPYFPYYEALFGGELPAEAVALDWMIRDARHRVAGPLAAFRRAAVARRVRRWQARLRAGFASSVPFRSLFSANESSNGDSQITSAVANWCGAVRMMAAMCATAAVPALFLAQPVPERDKPLTTLERGFLDAYPEMRDLRSQAYPRLLERFAELSADGISCALLTDVFAGCAEAIYTDHVHFEDRGCAIVANRIAELISSRWPAFRGDHHSG